MKKASAPKPSQDHSKLFTVYAPEKGQKCSHTQSALKMLSEHNFKEPEDVLVVNCSKADLLQKTGQNTYPQVYMKNNRIGGEDNLVGYMRAYEDALESDTDSSMSE